MKPSGSPKTLERRRAIALLEQGLSLSEVARRVQASVGSVCQWRQAWRAGGAAALAPKPVAGQPRKLTEEQHYQLLQLLVKGARACGFPIELWALRRIAAVILVQFGMRHHPLHVWKVLGGLDWSCQVQERRAIQGDEHAIAHWKRDQRPAIKKPAQVPRVSA